MTQSKLGRLLIVDDEGLLLKALCETLTEQNYDVVGAASGREGLQALHAQPCDVLLSDLMMPGMDGIQLLRQARCALYRLIDKHHLGYDHADQC